MKVLTRAERYKRNFRIIKNTYQDTNLARMARTWGEKRLFDELGIDVKNKRTPVLKQINTQRQKTYYTRKLQKFVFARAKGMKVVDAKRMTPFKESKIVQTSKFLKARNKKNQKKLKNIKDRQDLWASWGFKENKQSFPPEIEKAARDRNRKTKVGKKQLDDFAEYGYVVQYYMFVENRTFEEIQDLVKPDPHDALRIRYKTAVRVI